VASDATVDAVFFDLYGTLLVYRDMAAAWARWLDTLHLCFQACGVETDRGTLASRCDGFFSKPEPIERRDGSTVYERRLATVCEGFGFDATPAQLRMLADESADSWQRHVPLDPAAPIVLAELAREFPVVLVSNFDHPPYVHRVLEREGIADYFAEVVISADVGVKKPDPRIFAGPLERLQLQPHRVVYVGDAPEDVAAAVAAGVRPILVRRGVAFTAAEASDFRTNRAPSMGAGEAGGVPTVASLPQVLERLREGSF
jgi:HAD superfamily hydrolase (TIGR01549 family)